VIVFGGGSLRVAPSAILAFNEVVSGCEPGPSTGLGVARAASGHATAPDKATA
jgi:hypothetical protein